MNEALHPTNLTTYPLSSLVEGDEQADGPKSQLNFAMLHVWQKVLLGVVINTTAFLLGLHLLLLKSSMDNHFKKWSARLCLLQLDYLLTFFGALVTQRLLATT